MKNKIISFIVLLIFVFSFSGCGCKESTPGFGLNLEVWGVNDDQDVFYEIFQKYPKINPKIKKVTYRKFSAETYKQELLDALASGKGPDIFMINSTWEPSFRNKIAPAPPEVISEKMFRDNFVDLASDAFIIDGKVNAVPLSVDSLALYYNKSLFAEAGIPTPPKTWEELFLAVPKLTKVDSSGQINQSAISMGTAYNINRSTDILGLLMLQKGVEMAKDDGSLVTFKSSKSEEALKFYTDFATRNSYSYTWNPSLHWSIDAFAEGSTAMMLNYSWHIDTIRNKSPKLNFTVAPIPQFSDGIKADFGNCYGFVVAINKKPEISGADPNKVSVSEASRIRETWNFLKYLTLGYSSSVSTASGGGLSNLSGSADTKFDPTVNYLEKTGKPSARKDLIEAQKGIYELGVFAEQNLIAKNWKQLNPEAIETIMAEMIDNVNRGKFGSREAIDVAVARINKLISD